jgi:hypothetical protein
MNLYTTDEVFDLAHEIADKGHSKNVDIPRQILINILMDHSQMLTKLKDRGENIIYKQK